MAGGQLENAAVDGERRRHHAKAQQLGQGSAINRIVEAGVGAQSREVRTKEQGPAAARAAQSPIEGFLTEPIPGEVQLLLLAIPCAKSLAPASPRKQIKVRVLVVLVGEASLAAAAAAASPLSTSTHRCPLGSKSTNPGRVDKGATVRSPTSQCALVAANLMPGGGAWAGRR